MLKKYEKGNRFKGNTGMLLRVTQKSSQERLMEEIKDRNRRYMEKIAKER